MKNQDVTVKTVLTATEYETLQTWAETAQLPVPELVRQFIRKAIYKSNCDKEQTKNA